jgi:hypothetical protein
MLSALLSVAEQLGRVDLQGSRELRSVCACMLAYLTTRTSCTCDDASISRHVCKHMLAVRLHCVLVAEQQAKPKVDDGEVRRLFARL